MSTTQQAAEQGPTPSDLAAAVMAHAEQHYTAGGWDVIVECWELADIEERVTEYGAATVESAVASFAPLVAVWAERQADAEIEGQA